MAVELARDLPFWVLQELAESGELVAPGHYLLLQDTEIIHFGSQTLERPEAAGAG